MKGKSKREAAGGGGGGTRVAATILRVSISVSFFLSLVYIVRYGCMYIKALLQKLTMREREYTCEIRIIPRDALVR